MDCGAAPVVDDPHLRKFKWKRAVQFFALVAFLGWAGWFLLKPSVNLPKLPVGSPLPPGKVRPEVSYNYAFVRMLVAPDGSLWGWKNDIHRASLEEGPPQRIGSDSDWLHVATILTHTLALKTDGSLWAWGSNPSGALAQPASLMQTNEPMRIGSDTNWSQISVGAGHCLALKRDGSLWAWGQNEHGQVGNGTTSTRFTVTRIGHDSDWSVISAAAFSSFALRNDGSLWGWGYSNGPSGDVISPRHIECGGKIVAISANDFLVLALRFDGTLWICGPNAQAAAPAYVNPGTPDRLIQIGKDRDWKEIYAGTCCFFARKKNGSWWFSGMLQHGGHVPALRRLSLEFDPCSFAPCGGDALLLTEDGVLWDLSIEPDRGKFATTIAGLKQSLNQACAILPGRPQPFDPRNVPVKPDLKKLWELPRETVQKDP